MAAEALSWTDSERTGTSLPDGQHAVRCLAEGRRVHAANAADAARRAGLAQGDGQMAVAPLLALFGLPPALAEPVGLLADTLGWRVMSRACGGSVSAQLCIAMLPANPGETSPLFAWSTDNILNELISREALSILEQPLCVFRLETLLQRLGRPLGAVEERTGALW